MSFDPLCFINCIATVRLAHELFTCYCACRKASEQLRSICDNLSELETVLNQCSKALNDSQLIPRNRIPGLESSLQDTTACVLELEEILRLHIGATKTHGSKSGGLNGRFGGTIFKSSRLVDKSGIFEPVPFANIAEVLGRGNTSQLIESGSSTGTEKDFETKISHAASKFRLLILALQQALHDIQSFHREFKQNVNLTVAVSTELEVKQHRACLKPELYSTAVCSANSAPLLRFVKVAGACISAGGMIAVPLYRCSMGYEGQLPNTRVPDIVRYCPINAGDLLRLPHALGQLNDGVFTGLSILSTLSFVIFAMLSYGTLSTNRARAVFYLSTIQGLFLCGLITPTPEHLFLIFLPLVVSLSLAAALVWQRLDREPLNKACADKEQALDHVLC